MKHNIECTHCQTIAWSTCDMLDGWIDIVKNLEEGPPAYYGICPTCAPEDGTLEYRQLQANIDRHQTIVNTLQDKTTVIGEFLHWLPTQGINLYTTHNSIIHGIAKHHQITTGTLPTIILEFFKQYTNELEQLEAEKQQLLTELKKD